MRGRQRGRAGPSSDLWKTTSTGAPTSRSASSYSTMFVIDVRPKGEYDAGHFPASVSIPLDELVARHGEIPDGARVVVYCRGELCRMAREAAVRLRRRGVDARAMEEGVVEWRATKDIDLESA